MTEKMMLSAGTLPAATFTERVEAASNAGFSAISLFPEHYLNARKKENLSVKDMQQILSENGMVVDEVDPLLDWFSSSKNDVSRSESLLYEIADSFGATTMNVAPGLAPAISQLQVVEHYARVCKRASRYGLTVTLEFLPWTLVSDLHTALQIVEQSGQSNAGVMLDAWHFFRSGSKPEDILKLSSEQASLITSVQVNDAPRQRAPYTPKQMAGVAQGMLKMGYNALRTIGVKELIELTSKTDHPGADAGQLSMDACFARLMPGEGDIPLVDIFSALKEVGCQPKIGLEVFSLSKLSPNEIAQQACQSYLRRVLEK